MGSMVFGSPRGGGFGSETKFAISNGAENKRRHSQGLRESDSSAGTGAGAGAGAGGAVLNGEALSIRVARAQAAVRQEVRSEQLLDTLVSLQSSAVGTS